MKKYLTFLLMTAVFISCDVRRKDKVADDTVQQMEIQTKKNALLLKDSTTVQAVDTAYNFGTIKEGEKVEYNFRFKNTGQKPLVITDAHASCGCTVPEKPEKPILPGETGILKVVFNSKGKSGHQEKNITVNSNANPSFPELKLIGEVEKAAK